MCDAVMPHHAPHPMHSCVIEGEHPGKPHETLITQATAGVFAGLRTCWHDPMMVFDSKVVTKG